MKPSRASTKAPDPPERAIDLFGAIRRHVLTNLMPTRRLRVNTGTVNTQSPHTTPADRTSTETR
jgi:hypothetical protein